MYFAPKLPSPRLRFAVALGADFGVFASRASIIAPSSLALTVTTRAVGSRQFASHAWGGGRADIVFAPRAIVGELRLAKDSEMRASVFWREGTYLTRQSRHTFRPSFWPKNFARNCVSRPHTIKSNLSIAPRASSVSVAGAFEFSSDARPTARVRRRASPTAYGIRVATAHPRTCVFRNERGKLTKTRRLESFSPLFVLPQAKSFSSYAPIGHDERQEQRRVR